MSGGLCRPLPLGWQLGWGQAQLREDSKDKSYSALCRAVRERLHVRGTFPPPQMLRAWWGYYPHSTESNRLSRGEVSSSR